MAQHLLKGPFTVEVYQRLAELGILSEHERVELVGGQVVEMSPIGDRHASCVRRLNRLLAQQLLKVALIDVQNPVVLGTREAPQPDLTLLAPRPDGYRQHPRAADVLLVIEVADTTVAYDRDVKVPLYARSGVPETWLVDLSAERIVVYRDPLADAYTDLRVAFRGDALAPLRFPSAVLSVEAILG